MTARSYFGVGFLRGLNSVVEVFAPYTGDYECSPSLQLPPDWSGLGEDPNLAFADTSEEVSERQVTQAQGRPRTGKSVVSTRWGGALPPVGDLEKIDRIVPGTAERFLSMAEKKLDKKLSLAEKRLDRELNLAEQNAEQRLSLEGQKLSLEGQKLSLEGQKLSLEDKKLVLEDKKLILEDKKLSLTEKKLSVAESEQVRRFENMKRGQYYGWLLAMGAVIAAVVANLYHAPWQVSVALVGIPVLGAVQVMIPERKEKSRRPATRWF